MASATPQLPPLPQGLPKTQADWTAVCNALQAWQQQLAGPVWQAPTLGASIANFGAGWQDTGYAKDSTGRVHLRGLVTGAGLTPGATLFTLPLAYRPAADELFVAYGFNTAATVCRLDVYSNGNVAFNSATNGNPTGFLSLAGIGFQATY